MKPFQSVIERSLYILLMLTLVVNVLLGTLLYANIMQIKSQQDSINTATLKVEKKQEETSQSLRSYIACILAIDPHGDIKVQEQVCYNKVP